MWLQYVLYMVWYVSVSCDTKSPILYLVVHKRTKFQLNCILIICKSAFQRLHFARVSFCYIHSFPSRRINIPSEYHLLQISTVRKINTPQHNFNYFQYWQTQNQHTTKFSPGNLNSLQQLSVCLLKVRMGQFLYRRLNFCLSRSEFCDILTSDPKTLARWGIMT